MISYGEQGTEPPPPPLGVTSVPTHPDFHVHGGRARFEMLCIHLETSLPAATELAGLTGVRGDVLEAELLPAAVLKGWSVRSCPAHSGCGVAVRAGLVPSGHSEAAQPCCSGFPRRVLLLGTS